MTALTSVGNVRSCVLTQVILNGFGLWQEAVKNMIKIISGQEEQFFVALIVGRAKTDHDTQTVKLNYKLYFRPNFTKRSVN